MKKLWIAFALVLSLGTICIAADKVEPPDSCKHCGMDRAKFSHSRMIVTYADNSSTGTCSINCVVTDIKVTKKEVKSYLVADYNSRKLTDAKTAAWVIGGSKKGVMTKTAKWAFAEKADAEAFIKANGGKLAAFDEVLKAAEKDEAERSKSMKPHDHKGHGDHKM